MGTLKIKVFPSSSAIAMSESIYLRITQVSHWDQVASLQESHTTYLPSIPIQRSIVDALSQS